MNLLIVIAGVIVGTIAGGVLGLLLGMGALALPGLGPMIAAGSLATLLGTASISAIAGAVLGGGSGLLLIFFSNNRPRSTSNSPD